MIHRLYASGPRGLVFDLRRKGPRARSAAYLLSFVNLLVPDVDPEKAGWAIPPHLSALAATAPAMMAMAGLVAAAAVLMVTARWRPGRPGPSPRAAGFGLVWVPARTSAFAVVAHPLLLPCT